MAWPYSKTFFPEPLVGLTLSTGVLFLCVYARRRKIILLAAAGASFAIAILTKLVIIPVIGLCLIYVLLLSGFPARRKIWESAVFLLFPLIVLALIGVYNHTRFGNICDSGYQESFIPQDVFTGLYGFLLSPGKSIFIYSPILVISALMSISFFRKYKREAVLLFATVIFVVVVHSMWPAWDGGVCWGPRYLLPIIPFVLLPVGMMLEGNMTRTQAIVLYTTVLCSICIQLLPVLLRYDIYIASVGRTVLTDFEWRFFPIAGHFRKLLEVNCASFDIASLNDPSAIHNGHFKDQMSKTLDLWFVYAYKLRMGVYTCMAAIPAIVCIVSGLLLWRTAKKA